MINTDLGTNEGHGLCPTPSSSAEHIGLDPFRPYNSPKSVSHLKLNETNETL
jgi:hypothetical protein